MGDETRNIAKIEAGRLIFGREKQVKQIALIVKGTIRASNDFMEYVIPSGNVIGILDSGIGDYIFDYYAMDECMIYYMDFTDYDDVSVLSSAVKEYKELCATSAEYQLKEMISVYKALNKITLRLCEKIKVGYEEYKQLCMSYMVKPIVCKEIDMIEMPVDEEAEEYTDREYLTALTELPRDIHKAFFESNFGILKFHLSLDSNLAELLNEKCMKLIQAFQLNNSYLYSTGTGNVFAMYSKLALAVAEAKGNTKGIVDKMQELFSLIKESKRVTEEVLGLEYNSDYTRIRDIFMAIDKQVKSNASEDIDTDMLMDYSRSAVEDVIAESTNTFHRLAEYAGYNESDMVVYEKCLTVFRSMKDKFGTDEDSRKLRKKLTEGFYSIYEKVFLKAEEENNHERYIDVFLNFGCIDEKMLSTNTIVDIYSDDAVGRVNDGNDDSDINHACVFTIRQWLSAIYNGRREPSKNEFDLDYVEEFRERKKTEKFTEAQEKAYMNDQTQKVCFEIRNMFVVNNRLTNGQISTFCPILKEEDFMKTPREIRIKRADLLRQFEIITDIDFQAFAREYMYENIEDKIMKMGVNKIVYPDIILMPNVGRKGSMWQEIAGKRRDSRGRFLLPVYILEDMKQALIRMTGAFRWELCRTIQGTYWNDLRERSLTSEYCDYIQFYRKNKELSEETKEKIKKQLVKSRNNTKEMFVRDYEVWIEHESLGLSRLNKVSRMVLFAYCPFSKKYRDKLVSQPLFAEGVARYEREKLKKLKELNNKYTSIRNANGLINSVLEDNLNFIKDN